MYDIQRDLLLLRSTDGTTVRLYHKPYLLPAMSLFMTAKIWICERVWTKNPINCNHDNGCTWCVASWGCKLVTMITCCVLFYNPVLNTSYLHHKSYTYSKNSMHVIWSIPFLVIYYHNYYEPKDNSNCCQTSVINIVSTRITRSHV